MTNPKVSNDLGNPRLSREDCLALNMYHEARGESEKGMRAVSAVVINRVNSRKYPGTHCQVVFQYKQFSWTHQQSWDSNIALLTGKARLKQKDLTRWELCRKLASLSDKELTKSLPRNTVFYHALHVNPKWSKMKAKVAVIGKHAFYKE